MTIIDAVCVLLTAVFVICGAHGVKRETHAQKILHVAYDVETDPALKSYWRQAQTHDYNSGLPDVRFECEIVLSPTPPVSVHTLRPGDIGVIAAVGDSITEFTALPPGDYLEMTISLRPHGNSNRNSSCNFMEKFDFYGQ